MERSLIPYLKHTPASEMTPLPPPPPSVRLPLTDRDAHDFLLYGPEGLTPAIIWIILVRSQLQGPKECRPNWAASISSALWDDQADILV